MPETDLTHEIQAARVFEFAVQSATRIRLRIGRLHLRTWKSLVMLLPRGYRDSDAVYYRVQDREFDR